MVKAKVAEKKAESKEVKKDDNLNVAQKAHIERMEKAEA